jgi:hypothetical protein
VGPKHIAGSVPVKPSKASIAGVRYVSATGNPIPNLGEKEIRGVLADNKPIGRIVQIAEQQGVGISE